MFYDAAKRDHGLPQDPLKSLIVPRPIGWISTVDRQGRVNLAPYSFYNAMSEFPPIVCFGITGTYGSTPTKHSRMNAESTGEFVVNMVSEALKEQMNVTTTMVAFGVDELKLADAKTKALAASFSALGLSNALLIGGSELDANFARAASNIPGIDVLPIQGINVYDIMRRGKLVLTKAAVDALEARFK